MDELKKLLKEMSKSFGKHFDEDNVIEEVKGLITEAETKAQGDLAEKDKVIKTLEDEVKELKPLAADGKAYRSELVEDYIKMKASLEDISEKEEDQEEARKVIEGYPINFLKNEREVLQKRMSEKFPDNPQTKGDTGRDKQGKPDGTDDKKWEKSDTNPLIHKAEDKK